MAWYHILLIALGGLTLCLLASRAYNGRKQKERRRQLELAWQEEKRQERELLERNHYIPPYCIRVGKDFLSPFGITPIPLGATPLGDDQYRTADGDTPPISAASPVIFFEPSHAEECNRYILAHYDEIVAQLGLAGMTFVYMPVLMGNLRESVSYNHPDAPEVPSASLTAEGFYRQLAANIAFNPTDDPLLIIPDYKWGAGYDPEQLGDSLTGCHAYQLNYIDDGQFDFVFRRHLEHIVDRHRPRYRLRPPSKLPIDHADESSIHEIAEEIQARINRLYAMGASEYLIRQLVALPEPKLSPLLITPDCHILLPGYNNLEIKMPTLSKVLFFFYLNHPEGVLFKELRDHKEELYSLYRNLSPLADMDKMEQSIEALVDSTRNSVNEKCSRIRAAFVAHFNNHLAQQYYVTGYAGEPKRILLDRSLVTDRSGLLRLPPC